MIKAFIQSYRLYSVITPSSGSEDSDYIGRIECNEGEYTFIASDECGLSVKEMVTIIYLLKSLNGKDHSLPVKAVTDGDTLVIAAY